MEYFSSGREVPQRYEDAYDLRKNRMKLKQQEDHDKVDSRYYKAPDQRSASSSHRRGTIVQSVMNSIAKPSELRVSSNNFSDRLPSSATTNKTAKMEVSSNCMNTCLDDSQRLPNNNNFMQNVRALTPLTVDRKTFVDTYKDMSMKDDAKVEERQLNNRSSTAESSCSDNTWLNRPVNVKEHYSNYRSQHKGYEEVSNVQRKQMSHASTPQDDRNKIVITEHYYVKETIQRKTKLKSIICYEQVHENAIKFEERISRQKRIETFWPQWILRQTRIQINQSANRKTCLLYTSDAADE